MLDDDPQKQPEDPDSDELTDLVEELVAGLLGATDPSAEMEEVKIRHPSIFPRVQSIYQRLVNEDMVQPAPRSPLSKDQILGYKLLRLLGRGGMGVVHLAEQAEPRRLVAIKLLRPDLLDVESSRTRFRHEIKAVARLQHPGIVQVFEARDDAEIPYFVMEYVEGKSMGEILTSLRGRDPARLGASDLIQSLEDKGSSTGTSRLDADQSWEQLGAHLGMELCDALQHAHERGVLHRDVKPSNILLTRDGRARLVDFGLARLEGETRLTRSEAELGSLPFIPPENLRGSVLPSERRDVYGLGVTLYEFLSLQNPFLAEEASETRRRILRAQAPSLRHWNPSLSWELETVIQKAMAPEPELRYASARAFGEDLARVSRREPISAKRPGAILRTRRWLQRHPSLAGMMAVALVLLVTGSLAFAFREGHARRESERLTRQAQESSYVAKIQSAGLALDRGGNLDEIRSLLATCPERLRGFEWRHLAERLDSSLFRVSVPAGRVLDIEWAVDGHSYAVLTRKDELLIYEPNGRRPKKRWKIPGLSSDCIAWRPGHQQIAFAMDDGTIVIRSTEGDQASEQIYKTDHELSELSALVFSRDGKTMFTGHASGQVLQIDVDRRQLVKRLQDEGAHVSSLSLSRNGKTLAVGTYAANSRAPAMTLVHGLEDGSLRRFPKNGSFGVHVAVDPTGELVFVATDAGLELIDLVQDKQRFLSRDSCLFPTLSQDGKRLACILGERRLQVFEIAMDTKRGKRTLVVRSAVQVLGHQGRIFDLCCEPATHRFWTGGDDPDLRCWNLDRSSPRYRIAGPPQRVTSMANLTNGRILTGDKSGRLVIHERRSSKELAHISESEILDLAIAKSDRVLVVHADGSMAALDSMTGVPDWSRKVHGVTCVTPIGEGYAMGLRSGRVLLHAEDAANDEELASGTEASIAALDHHAATGSLLVACADGSLRCFDLPGRRQRWQQTAHQGWIADAQIDPKGRYAVSIGQDKTARIWDLRTGEQLQCMEGMDRAPLALALSPDGNRLATSSGYARELRIWDPLRGALLASLPTRRVAFALTFSHTVLAAAGMADAAFGGNVHMGEIECWRGATYELPPDHKTPTSLDMLTPPPTRIR